MNSVDHPRAKSIANELYADVGYGFVLAPVVRRKLKNAALWWHTAAADLEQYAQEHGQELLAQEEELLKRYAGSNGICATYERCALVAEWALLCMPQEVAFLFPAEQDRTPEALAHILRRTHGDPVERVIPLIRERKAADAAAAYSHLAVQEQTAPAPPSPVLPNVLPELDEAERLAFLGVLRNVTSIEAIDEHLDEKLCEFATRLDARNLVEAERDHRLAVYKSNLDKVRREWMARKGLRG